MILYVGVDEAIQIHEKIFSRIINKFYEYETNGIFTFNWVIIGGAVALIFIVYFSFLIIKIDKRVKFMFILSGFLYLSGAILAEMIGGFYIDKVAVNFNYQILATIEESFEMFGIAFFIRALMKYIKIKIEDSGFSILIR